MALQWTSIIFYTIASTLLLFLAKCVYNVCFHPLRNYPGPLLARATRLYHLYYDLTGVQHLKQKEWHDIYGEVVRVAPDELSYNSAQAWYDICGHRPRDRPSFEKDQGFFGGTEQFTDTHIVIANEKDHRRLRRLQSPAFSEKALMAQQDVIKVHTDRFIDQLRKRALLPESSRNDNDNNNEQKSGEGEKVMNGHDDDDAGVIDMVQWLNFLLFDTTGDLAFGSPFGCLVEGVPSRYIDVIFGLVKFGNWYRAARRFPSPLKELIIIAVIPRNLINDQQFQLRISREKVEERMKRVTERPDFMSYFLRANEQNGMTLREIQAGASIFLIAGSETTATLLSGAFYLLLTNPKYLNRLTDEVRTTFKHESDINMQSTAGNMPFLQAVLQESLRLYPPAPNSFPRETPEPGEIVCGRFVPAKTAVGIHQWSANRSSRNFYLPDEFIPERWMGVDERFENDKRDASQPFSYGPRNCIGQNLAYAEMRLTMCRVLWNFDLELHDDSRNWMREQKTFTLWEKEPLKIRLRTASH